MADNSDYKKTRTNLTDYLPEIYKSDTNRSVFENLFNRFLTKSETEKVKGYIGQGNPDAIIKRQIHEHTVHRQGYQLQPILYNKIGSEEYIASWYDILNEADRQGIDRDAMVEWLNLEKFNWVPPIDLDKFINYRDYYWDDGGDNNSKPHYLTIRSRCAVAEANVTFQQDLIEEFGLTIPTMTVGQIDEPTPAARIMTITASTGTITVLGDITDHIRRGQFFEITGSYVNGITTYLTEDPTFDPITDRTTVHVPVDALNADEVADNNFIKFNFKQYNKLIIQGEYIRLFTPGFVFMYKNSLNTELNNAFWTVLESRFIEDGNLTELTIDTTFTDSRVDGVISQEEALIAAAVARDCQCSESIGWDIMQWDDNPMKPLWENYNSWYTSAPTGEDQLSLIDSIKTPNNAEPTETENHPAQWSTPNVNIDHPDQHFWWDTDRDTLNLKVAVNNDGSIEWKVVWKSFSTMVESSLGTAYWDYVPGCGIQSITTSADQWINTNKWIHKYDVDNFSTAKQAEMPIIEFSWDLELNEWTHTTYKWKYRKINTETFVSTDRKPYRIELEPLSNFTAQGDHTIVFNESYGDMTDFFTPGREFMVINFSEIFVVEQAYFRSTEPGAPHRTEIVVQQPINTMIPSSGSSIRATATSAGDAWKGYNIHWLFDGVDNTVPTNHQPYNQLTNIPFGQTAHEHASGQYLMTYTHYAQEIDVVIPKDEEFNGTTIVELYGNLQSGSSRTLNKRAVKGFNQVRVYVNGIRQYGTYSELSQLDLTNSQIVPPTFIPEFVNSYPYDKIYVAAIKFKPGYELNKYDVVRIEVGEASTADLGRGRVPVRTIEDNLEFVQKMQELASQNINQVSDSYVSLIEYNKTEQVKTETNQYPLFDIYNMDGTTANKSNNIFGYHSTPDSPVYGQVGLRVALGQTNTDYLFEQLLLDSCGGMYAYRDYSERKRDFWVNPVTQEVKFWDGFTWCDKEYIGEYYIGAHVGDNIPPAPYDTLNGMYWYDVSAQQLKQYRSLSDEWIVVYNVENKVDDETLVSIWRKGLNNERYEPHKRDWNLRTEEEYNDQRDAYVKQKEFDLYFDATGSLTEEEAHEQALATWHSEQANHLSTGGRWMGDWEIPDPLYYNHMHENRHVVSFRELYGHFSSIISSQPRVPGFLGPIHTMFRLLPFNDVNYGLGGTIREYNYSFDTFLSSLFVNELTPRALFDYARDQYSVLLNNLRDIYRHRALDLLTNQSVEAFADTTRFVVDRVLLDHETDTSLSTLYHDSTTYDPDTKAGFRNWIATLPYIGLASNMKPTAISDPDRDISEVIHHDAHRATYLLADSVIRGLSYSIVNKLDTRGNYQNPQNPTETLFDSFGKVSDRLPPNDFNEFGTYFNTSIINREGTYWLHVERDQSNNIIGETLYRLNVASIGELTPSPELPDGTLWYDMNVDQEILRQKQTIDGDVKWVKVEGLVLGDTNFRLHNGIDPNDLRTASVSCWQKVDFEEQLRSIILEVERRLYDHAPNTFKPKYDFEALKETQPIEYESKLQDTFTDYLKDRGILNAYANSDYSSTDPFTWNYKYSAPGETYDIVDVNPLLNAFIVEGNRVGTFTSGAIFRIKNSNVNQGTWTVSSSGSTFNGSVTTIYVTEDVVDNADGVIYTGHLPSAINDGSESGGYWKDLYEKVYGTPYPHLEPWKLQGYTSKPDWWDEEYLNDDVNQWGTRRWKYKHGFEITNVDIDNEAFIFKGDFTKEFTDDRLFSVDQSDPSVHGGNWNVAILDSIAAIDPIVNSFEIDGDVTGVYLIGHKIRLVDINNNDLGQFTIEATTYLGPPSEHTEIYVKEDISSVRETMSAISGAIYNPFNKETILHIDSTFSGKNDITVPLTEGRIARKLGMWYNIQRGRIPAGRHYPDGTASTTGNPTLDGTTQLPTWSYFSTNIGNVTTVDGYSPDAVFPPYWDRGSHFQGTTATVIFDKTISSIMSNYSAEIAFPALNYAYGDMGPIEWSWRHSHDFMYGQLAIAFQLDPIRTMALTFGVDFYNIGGLLVSKKTNKTLSHTTTTFHGDIVENEIDVYNGINQWYVNYIRTTGFDASSSDFRDNWTKWNAPLTYQFASFIDTPSLELAHRYVPITEFDYEVTSKKSAGVEDYLIEGLKLYTTKIPPKKVSVDNDKEWEFELTTPSSNTELEYYDIRNYPFYADVETNSCMAYTWEIEGVDMFSNTIIIPGNQVAYFEPGSELSIERTGDYTDIQAPIWNNDNNVFCDDYYKVISASYNVVTNQTVLELGENVLLQSNTVAGIVRLHHRDLPWELGQKVALSSDGYFPTPLQGDTAGFVYEYFLIPGTKTIRAHYDCNNNYVPETTVPDKTIFQLALTLVNAQTGVPVEIETSGQGTHFVGEVKQTFTTATSNKIWKRYVLDKDTVIQKKSPFTVNGMQSVINIVDGYKAKLEEDGWVINSNSKLVDPNTGATLSYETELQHFINFNMTMRSSSNNVSEKYGAVVDVASNVFTLDTAGSSMQLITGDIVNLHSDNNLFPIPFSPYSRYYLIRDTLTTFRLAATKSEAHNGIAIDVFDLNGAEQLYVSSAAKAYKTAPKTEINPIRNGVWFRPSRGIVSNIVTGPTTDLYNTQLMLDQYGRALPTKYINIFREDKETMITVNDGIPNDVELTTLFNDPYNYIHLSSMHLFIDTYEHILKFNNRNTDGQLIYDPFIGLNVTKFELLFNRQPEFTQRPNVGGQYLHTFYNQGSNLKRNIEASIEDLRLSYDTFQTFESNTFTDVSRRTMGYTGRKRYLDNLNANAKSQFLFWRGQIQHKGSMNSVNAFVRSRRFVDAYVDEFWAVKIADFGSVGEKEYISMWLSTMDTKANEVRWNFAEPEDINYAGYASNRYGAEGGFAYPITGYVTNHPSFDTILLTDQYRWYNQPRQLKRLRDNGGSMHFDLKPMMKHNVTIVQSESEINIEEMEADLINRVAPRETQNILVRSLTNPDTNHYRTWDINTQEWVDNGNTVNGQLYIRHNDKADFVTVTLDWVPPQLVMYQNYLYGTNLAPVGDVGLEIDADNFIYESGTGSPQELCYEIRTPYEFIVMADSIRVFKNGKQLVNGVDYIEQIQQFNEQGEFDPNSPKKLTSNTILLTEGVRRGNPPITIGAENSSGDVIRVVYKTSNLTEGFHYEIVNSDIIKLNDMLLVNPHADIDEDLYIGNNPNNDILLEPKNLTIWTWMVDNDKHNPAKIIDTKSETVVRPIQIWDPARGLHYHNAAAVIDIQSQINPAMFSNTPMGGVEEQLGVKDLKRKYTDIFPSEWNQTEVGKTWLDTSLMYYKPYYDSTRWNIGKRSALWGKLADFGEFHLYTWVESDVPPSQWDDIALVEEGDISIHESVRKTGKAKKTLFVKNASGQWERFTPYIKEFDVAIDGDGTSVQSIIVDDPSVTSVDVYSNGTLIASNVQLGSANEVQMISLRISDRIQLVANRPSQDVIDAEVEAGNMLEDYEYTEHTTYDDIGKEVKKYYFWVENKSTRGGKRITPREAQETLETIPMPYMFFDGVKPEQVVEYGDDMVKLPLRFTRSVIKNIRGIVQDDQRYIVRWTRDETLRDSLAAGRTPLDLKNLHEEWKLIRADQLSHIPRWLWDKVTESIVGYKIDTPEGEPLVRVPAIEYELYDTQNGTDTQYGLEDGQTFTHGGLALATILGYLNDQERDFKHIDMDVFYQYNSFDTNENIVKAMDTIYNTFNYLDVNHMFFECLLDALSVKRKYEGIFKTSMIALHGVRPFQVGGMFDD